ncbi:transposase [Hyella patelloides LEGE 07179]|uniref:Transposase n=1 Tax=Hyella patelloides LEGE 07179 TaxID=945734 RepID=A0A563VMQ3_9CYAN|nr:RNA-guided endonuclease TnpB family protein [Hyella patelloides]VEP12734.1 transposase [Hyella patelloides LEGE 07179]
MKARYNYRIYPKPHQIVPLAKAFGCARTVWNDALWLYKQAFINGEPRPKDVDKRVITQAKKTEQRAWLAEVSNIVLQQSFRDLQTAWNNYFNSQSGTRKGKEVGSPKFKKKSSRQTIRLRKGGFSVHSQSVKVAKIGHIKMVVSRPLPSAPSSVTIIKDSTGRYFASFVVEVPGQIAPQTDNSCGIDLGLTHFCILSSGEKVENPRLHKKMLKRIKKANRRLLLAKRDSKRRERRKRKLAKLHAEVKDQRTDFLHKLTTRLVRENQTLAVEDLNVSGMVKNHKLSRAISDAGWAKFKTMLAAKCDKYGRDLTIVDRWFASSQLCSECGKSGGKKELDVREWECLFCNTIHDRDINASINLSRWVGGQSDQDGAYKLRGKPTQTAPHKNGRGASVSLPKVAVRREASTTYEQLSLF